MHNLKNICIYKCAKDLPRMVRLGLQGQVGLTHFILFYKNIFF